MKNLSVAIVFSDEDAALLLSKYSYKELEGMVQREAFHVFSALINDMKETIPLVQCEDERMDHSL